MDERWFEGATTEGGAFEATAFYRHEDPAGSDPVRIVGSYAAADGGGDFDVNAFSDLPEVVARGEWRLLGGVDRLGDAA